MSVDLSVPYVITAPTGTDGNGTIAVLNDTTSANFVGYLTDLSFAREIRENSNDRTGVDGAIHGPFYSGRLPFTLEVQMDRGASFAAANANLDKLWGALNAHRADGTIAWTESGGSARKILFRAQQSARGPSADDRKVQWAGVAERPMILSSTPGPSSFGTLNNTGTALTFPIITFTAPGSGTVTLTCNGQSLSLTVGGTTGLTPSSSTAVDFWARTVKQGSAFKMGAVQWPSSIWWAMVPGNNSVSSSAGGSIEWYPAWLP